MAFVARRLRELSLEADVLRDLEPPPPPPDSELSEEEARGGEREEGASRRGQRLACKLLGEEARDGVQRG